MGSSQDSLRRHVTMGAFFAAAVTAITAVAVVAAIYQVESHPTATKEITTSGSSVINSTVTALFK
jgi:hypothetical protein